MFRGATDFAMNLISPFEFRDMFRTAKSFAFVGNAPTVLEHQHGSLIDSHDVVVRFNRARTAEVERQVGSRTDVLFVNATNSRKTSPPPSETLRPRCVVCLVTPQGIRNFDIAPLLDWVGCCPLLLSFAPEGLPAVSRARRLTNGTCALYTIQRMFDVQNLFVTGFTLYGAAPGGTARYYKEDVTPQPENWHDLDDESRIFAELIATFDGQLHVTPEVEMLVRQNAPHWQYSNGQQQRAAASRRPIKKRLAEGLAWRVLKLGTTLRRVAEST